MDIKWGLTFPCYREKKWSLLDYYINGPGDLGSIPSPVIPKTQKMLLDAVLFSTQHYKVKIKAQMEQSREWISALLSTSLW